MQRAPILPFLLDAMQRPAGSVVVRRVLVRWQDGRIKRLGRWRLLALVLVMAGVPMGAGLFALQRWIGTDDFKARVQTRIGAAPGVTWGAAPRRLMPGRQPLPAFPPRGRYASRRA